MFSAYVWVWTYSHSLQYIKYSLTCKILTARSPGEGAGGGVSLGISGLGCASATLEPLVYTRANSAEFCYPILE